MPLPSAFCLLRGLSVRCKLEEIGNVGQAEDQAGDGGHSTAALVVEEAGLGEWDSVPARFQGTAAACEDVAHPVGVGTVSEGDDVLAATFEYVHGRAVGAVGLAPGVQHDTEAGQARRQPAGDAVRYLLVEARYRVGQGHEKAPWRPGG